MFLIYIANIYVLQCWFVFFTEFLPDKIYFLLAEYSLSQVHIWGYKILLSQTVPKLFCFISRISSSPMGWDQMKKSLSEIFWSFPQSGRESFAERPLLIRIEFDSTRFVWIRSKEHFDKWYFGFWKADKSNWSGQMVPWSERLEGRGGKDCINNLIECNFLIYIFQMEKISFQILTHL